MVDGGEKREGGRQKKKRGKKKKGKMRGKKREKERRRKSHPSPTLSKISYSSAFIRSYKMLARLSTFQSILISIFLPLLVNRALPF